MHKPEIFEGFSQETIDFMWGIRLNNNKEWFEANKDNYKRNFHAPMKALGQEVFAKMSEEFSHHGFIHKLSRIYKDARRVKGGEPYRDSLWFSTEKPAAENEESSGILTFWFELHPEGYSYGLGYYAAKAATMAALRERIDANPAEFTSLISRMDTQDEFTLGGPEYARQKQAPTPKTQQWYNKKSFSIIHQSPITGELFTREILERIVKGYRFLMPFYDYFVK